MKGYAKTDIGKAREKNQDYYYIPDSQDDLQLYVLADGMGGYNGGEIASKLATDSLRKYIKNNFETIEKSKEKILELIKNAIEYSNMVVYEKSKEEKELEGMGTTLEVCLIYNNKIFLGHIGDSRIYRVRKEIIRKLTKDHSYVQQLVEDGKITREEAVNHPKKNMLIRIRNIEKGDIIIMCSDGLTNMVTEQEIFEAVKQNVEKAPEILVQKANNAGGYDNITVVTIM